MNTDKIKLKSVFICVHAKRDGFIKIVSFDNLCGKYL